CLTSVASCWRALKRAYLRMSHWVTRPVSPSIGRRLACAVAPSPACRRAVPLNSSMTPPGTRDLRMWSAMAATFRPALRLSCAKFTGTGSSYDQMRSRPHDVHNDHLIAGPRGDFYLRRDDAAGPWSARRRGRWLLYRRDHHLLFHQRMARIWST